MLSIRVGRTGWDFTSEHSSSTTTYNLANNAYHDIFWFEITMDNFQSMKMLHSLDNPPQKQGGLVLRQSFLPLHILEQITALNVLSHHVDMPTRMDSFVVLDDGWALYHL